MEPKGKFIFGMVTVGEKGQIVIPKKARDTFDIKPGDSLLILGDIEQGIAIPNKETTERMWSILGFNENNSPKEVTE